MSELNTPRLWLRQWRTSDLEPFAALNADPAVMEFMSGCLGRTESDALARRCEAEIARQGFGLWAAQRRDSGAFIGFVGLRVPSFEAPFTPCVEIGWRLAQASWGNGFATEAARERRFSGTVKETTASRDRLSNAKRRHSRPASVAQP